MPGKDSFLARFLIDGAKQTQGLGNLFLLGSNWRLWPALFFVAGIRGDKDVDQAAVNRNSIASCSTHVQPMTLGEAMTRAESSITDPDIRRTWALHATRR